MYFNLFVGNTNGACVMFQNIIEQPLLWNPCCHHIGEVVLPHVWNALEIEVSKAPEIQLFKRMKTHYQTIIDRDISSIKFDNSVVIYKRKNEVTFYLILIRKICVETIKSY